MTTTPITSITDELIESLENGAPALAETCTIPGRMMAGLLTELRRLRAENEALQVDAANYRKLRDGSSWPAVFASSVAPEPLRGDQLEVAMQSNTKGN
jgi:hypothetical protein